MDRARVRLQAVVVTILVALVSWPQMRPVRATSIWRAHGPLEAKDEKTVDRRLQYDGERRARVGYGSLSSENRENSGAVTRSNSTSPEAALTRSVEPPAEAVALGARLNAIVGRARTNLNAPVPYARLILRNMITGQIEGRATADQEGRFTFIDVGASGYIIELVGPDGSIIASSETVAVENGDLKQATVRVAGAETVRALYGNVVGPSIVDPLTTAVEAGVSNTTNPVNCVSFGLPCEPR
jgi:hypothetical protein